MCNKYNHSAVHCVLNVLASYAVLGWLVIIMTGWWLVGQAFTGSHG